MKSKHIRKPFYRSIPTKIILSILLYSTINCVSTNHDYSIHPNFGNSQSKLGMSQKEIIENLGKPDEISRYTDSIYLNYFNLGMSVFFKEGSVVTIFYYAGRKGGYENGRFSQFPGSTTEGINMKSNYKDVIQVYGMPEAEGELSSAPIPSKWIVYKNKGIAFDFIIATGEIITISVSDFKRKNGLKSND